MRSFHQRKLLLASRRGGRGWPGPAEVGLRSPSCPRGAPCPSVWVNQNLLFVNRACLSLGAACPSSLPMALPVPVPSQARQVPCKPHAPQPLSVARRALCPALALLLAPWGRPPATALARSSPGLQHHPALPLQACHPWAAVDLWAALPAVPGGWGQRGGQEHPPGGRGLKGGVEGGRETGQPTARLGCAGSPPRPHRPIYYPSAIHRARQMPPNKYPQTIGWEGPARLLMNKHEGLWTQLPLFAKWDRLCGRHLKFSRGRAVFQCPLNC